MKVKSKEYVIGVISILIIATSISIFVPSISNNIAKNNKNYLNISIKKYNSPEISNNINQSSQTLIRNLSGVVEYVTNSVITKQNELESSILGGTDISGKKHKRSQLSSVNKYSPIGFNRYSKEVYATINNSSDRLKSENKKIDKIIGIIKNHPYNYDIYLNNEGIVIPNTDFFTNNNGPVSLKNTTISNNLYSVVSNNPSINSVSFASEESTLGASAISKSGVSLAKVIFKNISFTANIITFNPDINEYQFETPTTTLNSINSSKIIPAKNKSLNMNSSEFSKSISSQHNNSLHYVSNRIFLTESLSRNYINLYSNNIHYHVDNFGTANISYNHVYQYKYNKVLYSLLIVFVFPIYPLVIGTSIATTVFVIRYKDKKAKLKNNSAVNPENIPAEDTSVNKSVTVKTSQEDDKVTKPDTWDTDIISNDSYSDNDDDGGIFADSEGEDVETTTEGIMITNIKALRKSWVSEINNGLGACKNPVDGAKMTLLDVDTLIYYIELKYKKYTQYLDDCTGYIPGKFRNQLIGLDREMMVRYNFIITHRDELINDNNVSLLTHSPTEKDVNDEIIPSSKEKVIITKNNVKAASKSEDAPLTTAEINNREINDQLISIRNLISNFAKLSDDELYDDIDLPYYAIIRKLRKLANSLKSLKLDAKYKKTVEDKMLEMDEIVNKWYGIRYDKVALKNSTGYKNAKEVKDLNPGYEATKEDEQSVEKTLDIIFDVIV